MSHRYGVQMRVGLVAAIYEKTLRLPSVSRCSQHNGADDKSPNAGHATNLASNDVERFLSTAVYLPFLLYGPPIAIAILLVGVHTIGPVFGIGYALLSLLLPLQFYIGRRFATYRSQVASSTDERVTSVQRLVNGIRVVRYQCWETPFFEQVSDWRRKEVRTLRSAAMCRAVNEAVYYLTGTVVSVTVFVVHVGMGGELTPRNVFTTMMLLNTVQFLLTKLLPSAVMGVSECRVSGMRIQKFLELEEWHGIGSENPGGLVDKVHENNSNKMKESRRTDGLGMVLSLSNVTCHWNGPSHSTSVNNIPALSNVSLTLLPSQLYTIIGSVGSGKSALLLSLANELPLSYGTRSSHLNHRTFSISYASQNPFITDDTVRRNILGGEPFDTDRYSSVLTSCGLLRDLAEWPQGDETVLGDRGVRCSGGQKARIGLARALYRKSDILLLDDVLSAVDVGVAEGLWRDAIKGECCGVGSKCDSGDSKEDDDDDDSDDNYDDDDDDDDDDDGGGGEKGKRGRCVVVVTHVRRFVEEADWVVMVHKGRVVGEGSSYEECVHCSGGVGTRLFGDDGDDGDSVWTEAARGKAATAAGVTSMKGDGDGNEDAVVSIGVVRHSSERSEGAKTSLVSVPKPSGTPHAPDTQTEKRVTGVIHIKTWIAYSKALGGFAICFLFFLAFTTTEVSQLLVLIRVSKWARTPVLKQRDAIVPVLWGTGIVILLAIFRACFSFYILVNASQLLHDRMLRSVLRAKIEFFDTNPLGRILNRFSADVGICDETLPLTVYDFLVGLFVVLGAVVTAIVALPVVLVVFPPLLCYFLYLRKIFVTTTRELKRLEGIARSPIFAALSESLDGIATIRTNGQILYVLNRFEMLHDAHTRAYFSFVASSRWFAFQLDLLSFSFTGIAAFLAVLLQDLEWFDVNPAVLGLALTLLIQISTTNFPWIVRQSAEVANQMVSVERIIEFANLPPEASLETDLDMILKDWPNDTSIDVKNLTARHRSDLPTCLENVSFRIEAGQRVGIVGRTGSGKSSLLQTLFRFLEPESGSIYIGGVNISLLGLTNLRKSLSILPQTPVLFGRWTVRENLDPFLTYSESSVREALDAVQMTQVVDALPRGIESLVAEDGSNFSTGQRQLLCLARAILRNDRVLVLDEPTADVDGNTDKLLQKALQDRFQGATVLAVAHRLDTIIDYDRILVLGVGGKVLEFGSPKDLLEKEEGWFTEMVNSMGEPTAQILRRRAGI